MMAHGVALRLESCGKTFADGTRALEPVTLDVARGETLVLLGRYSSRKSPTCTSSGRANSPMAA